MSDRHSSSFIAAMIIAFAAVLKLIRLSIDQKALIRNAGVCHQVISLSGAPAMQRWKISEMVIADEVTEPGAVQLCL